MEVRINIQVFECEHYFLFLQEMESYIGSDDGSDAGSRPGWIVCYHHD